MLVQASGDRTARRSRKHHQKVRTGCAICKARRVKVQYYTQYSRQTATLMKDFLTHSVTRINQPARNAYFSEWSVHTRTQKLCIRARVVLCSSLLKHLHHRVVVADQESIGRKACRRLPTMFCYRREVHGRITAYHKTPLKPIMHF